MHVVLRSFSDKASPSARRIARAIRSSTARSSSGPMVRSDAHEEEFARAAMRDPSDPRPHCSWSLRRSGSKPMPRSTPTGDAASRTSALSRRRFRSIQPCVANPPDLAASTRARRIGLALSERAASFVWRRLSLFADAGHAGCIGVLSVARPPGNVSCGSRARALVGRDVEAARPLLRACIDASPGASRPLVAGTIDANEGKCADAEASARKSSRREPVGRDRLSALSRGRSWRHALDGRNRSILEMRWEQSRRPCAMCIGRERIVAPRSTMVIFKVHIGSLRVGCSRQMVDRRIRTAYSAGVAAELDRELGRTREAADAAQSSPSEPRLAASPYYDTDMGVAARLYLTFAIPRDSFLRDREAAWEKQRAKAGYYSSAGIRWMGAMSRPFGSPRRRYRSCRQAIGGTVDRPIEQDDGVDATLAGCPLANRPDDAIPFLRRATVSCQSANRSSMFAHTLARPALGEQRE